MPKRQAPALAFGRTSRPGSGGRVYSVGLAMLKRGDNHTLPVRPPLRGQVAPPPSHIPIPTFRLPVLTRELAACLADPELDVERARKESETQRE